MERGWSVTNASTGAADPVGFEMAHLGRPPGDAGRSERLAGMFDVGVTGMAFRGSGR